MTVFNETMGRPPPTVRPRVLVTGVNGFMGSYMADLLLVDRFMGEIDVVLTDMDAKPSRYVERAMSYDTAASRYVEGKLKVLFGEGTYTFGKTTYLGADLRNAAEMSRLVRRLGPFSRVLHIAGLFDPAASYEDLEAVNVRGTVNLINALAVAGRPPDSVVIWGDGGVYDFSAVSEKGLSEDAPIAPDTDHLRTKFESEMRAIEIGRRCGVPVTVLRPSAVYGPRARNGLGVTVLLAARGGMGPVFFGNKANRVGAVHAEDVCRAALFLSARPGETAYRCYNVNDDSSYTMYELSRAVAERLGFPMLPISFPLPILKRFVAHLEKRAAKHGRTSMIDGDMVRLRAYDTLLNASALKALGWHPIYPNALNGLMETIDRYEKEGRL